MIAELNPPADYKPLVKRLVMVFVCVALVLMVAARIAAKGQHDARSLTLERMRLIDRALDRYAVDNGGLIPQTRQGLRSLLRPPDVLPPARNWCGPYLSNARDIEDGWGRPFHYVAPGGGHPTRPYDLWSLGRDNKQGGTGADADIMSWDPTTLNP